MDSVAADRLELISVRNVSHAYDSIPVLQGISFSIYQGDFLAIIGPNGSGKTTLVKIILGLLKPKQGEVRIMGKRLDDFEDWARIGYVPQKATHIDPFFPASAREVVAMAFYSGKRTLQPRRSQGDAAVRSALRQVGMESWQNRAIGSLSGGQQQRIFIARAIVNKPHILILDEPTTGVDAETQSNFYGMLNLLNRQEGITIVQITHDIGIVNKHINRVACLNQRLVYHGDHEEFCRSAVFKEMLAGGHHLISHEH
jgi:zinc transport system ATP-binding protein